MILSRTKRAEDTIFVGDKNDTLLALKHLLTRRTQWTDYMEEVLKLITFAQTHEQAGHTREQVGHRGDQTGHTEEPVSFVKSSRLATIIFSIFIFYTHTLMFAFECSHRSE